MVKDTRESAFSVATKNVESILFDEHDTDKEEGRVSIAGKNMPESESNIAKPNVSKLMDKSKRAFSITIESSKAFEIAIRKPRSKFHHHVTFAKGDIYQFYVMLLKHHGKPSDH